MIDISLIILAAGESRRFEAPVKKQWLRIGDDPLWLYATKNIAKSYEFKKIVIVSNEDDLDYMRKFSTEFEFVKGGNLRQISLKNALEVVDSEFVLVSDAARASISQELVINLIKKASEFDCVSPYLGVNDTTYLGENLVDRDELKLIQTPQLSKTALLKKALLKEEIFTDDSAAISSVGGKLGFIEGKMSAHKITKISDLAKFDLKSPSTDIFCGNGFDVHALKEGEFLTICGVKIPCEFSFIAHSDGDAGIHALIDAICGASLLGDIGELFPDSDERYKGIDSKILLQNVISRVFGYGYEVVNADITIICDRPKLGKFKLQMRDEIAKILGTNLVNVKATTTEKLGFTGRGEGVAAMASVNLKYFNWQNL